MEPAELISGRVSQLGDVPVLLRAADVQRAAAVIRLLGGLEASCESPLAVLDYAQEAPAVPLRPPEDSAEDLRLWHDGEALVLQHPSDVRARASTDAIRVGGGTEHLSFAFQRLFHPAVTHMLAHRDRFVLHAAAVVDEGAAYLVLGATGAGKSTLGLAGLQAGWRLLGDDLVVVRQAPTGLQVAGIPRPAVVPSVLGGAVEGGRALLGDPRARWELPASRLTRGWFPVRGVILASHGDSALGGLRRLTGRQICIAALGSFSSVIEPLLLRRFFPRAAALSRLPGWELRHGVDPVTRLAAAGRLLADVVSLGRGGPLPAATARDRGPD